MRFKKYRSLREILQEEIEAILGTSDALNCVWNKIPEECQERLIADLTSFTMQKMHWTQEHGEQNGY